MPAAKKTARPKFPLRLHATGQWTCKRKGVQYYFGTDKDEALRRYMQVKDDLDAGRKPRERHGTATLADVINRFLTDKQHRVDSNELKAKTWSDYYAACKVLIDHFGGQRLVGDLRPEDFAGLRAKLAARMSPVSLLDYITRTRVMLRFAYEHGLIDAPVRFGNGFERPPRKTLRLERARRGLRFISAADLWRLIDAACPSMKAMILLGLNGGLGATDLSELTRSALRRRSGWLDYPRPKTGVARRFPLWPETLAAIAAVEAVRPEPKDPKHSDILFLTRLRQPWVRFNGADGKASTFDAIGEGFAKLAKKCGVTLEAGRFGILRHVSRTVADPLGDRPAIDHVMGHTDHSTAAYYRELVADERLQAVTDHMREWLVAGKPGSPDDACTAPTV